MQRKIALWLGLAIVAVTLMIWQFHQPTKDSLPPEQPDSPTAVSGGNELGSREQLPQPAPIVVPAPQNNNLSKEALSALVLAKLRAWDDDDEPALRSRRLQELDALLNGTNMLEIVQELPPDLMGYVFALPSLRQKLMADPKAALDWMSCHTNVSGPQLLTLIHDWRQQDPAEMQQYLAGLPEGEWKQAVMVTASNEALSSNPAEAVALAMQMNPGQQQAGMLAMAATEWAKRDPEAVEQWLNQVNDPDLREQLAGSSAIGYAELDPSQAMDWALQSLPPGQVLDQSLAEIAWTWAMRDPATVGTWVAQFPEGQARQMALENLLSVWGNHDPDAALAWIESLPEGPLQTEAARDLLAAVPPAE